MLCRIRHDDSPSLITDHWLLMTALWRDLPDRALSIRSARRHRAVEIAVGVEGHGAIRKILAIEGEVVEVGQRPGAVGLGQLENHARLIGAVTVRSAVEITGRVQGEIPVRPSVGSGEAEDDLVCPPAAIAQPSESGGAIEVASSIHYQTTKRF